MGYELRVTRREKHRDTVRVTTGYVKDEQRGVQKCFLKRL